ncbi:MAG: phosphoribosylformylglycinamidine cyclo-ligase [candidate division Zixibacteria bacterium CG_4_9_14_3_um_filter_46_8]|nr:MAG: phosphoribosylformylglycinamidine cyclo-ligase [candidate division Zixibacteria bacterium CG_4_9_14_3_um_filter_46_8]
MDYREAGVDIEAGNAVAKAIARLAKNTFNSRVVRGLGSFGGFFDISKLEIKKPVLVSSTDGVGTKLLVAQMTGHFRNLGKDIVNHCVNDIACCGARPLFFMDYFASSHLKPETVLEVIAGMTEALGEVGCPLVGGETAEMPDLYSPGDFDIAGFIVGVVDLDNIIDGHGIIAGDKILILPSNGLHTNGYTLARKALFETAGFETSFILPPLEHSLGDELLKPHPCYLEPLRRLGIWAKGIAHITGGGLHDNIIRILPEDCCALVDISQIPVPPIFEIIRRAGAIEDEEMYRVFNMGAGLVVIIDKNKCAEAIEQIRTAGFEPIVAGEITSARRDVILQGLSVENKSHQ